MREQGDWMATSEQPEPPEAPQRSRRPYLLAGAALAGAVLLVTACAMVAMRPTAVAPALRQDSSATDVAGQARGALNTAASLPHFHIADDFVSNANGWPDVPDSYTTFEDTEYLLRARDADRFVAVDAPSSDAFHDGIISARFHKVGGPGGGGYGLIVADQGPEVHDGTFQGGRFIVAEAGDQGTFGIWQREQDRWIDLATWTPTSAVHVGYATNELSLRAQGKHLTFSINGSPVGEVDTNLPAGRVGVFAGGDGNEVALEHFEVEWPLTGEAVVQAGLTPAPSGTPQPTAVSVDALRAELDAAWGQQRWSDVFRLLDQMERIAPDALNFSDKRYAAHMAAGQDLLAKAQPAAAASEFSKAQAVDPDRPEAVAALHALTPTPTPAPLLPGSGKPLSDFVGGVMDDVDNYWSGYFRMRGAHYLPASRHWYDARITTACGAAVPGRQGPFYCVLDGGVYLDTRYMQQVRGDFGEFPVAYVVAHEIGHNVQTQLGITKVGSYIVFGQTFSREIELQADCLAGVWSKTASGRGMVTSDAVGQALTLAWKIGDPAWVSQRSDDAHGTPDDRTAAFLKGFNQSRPSACGLN